jgi:SAM-dependent methyltransferase
MHSFWQPQSALFLPDLPGYASAYLLQRQLASGRLAEILYRGDRMWPAIRSGASVRVLSSEAWTPKRGELVVVSIHGALDLLRITRCAEENVEVCGDADPGPPVTIPRAAIRARLADPTTGGVPSSVRRALRRALLDLREASAGRPDQAPDPADTVRQKYDAQAPYYARARTEEVPPPLLARVRAHVRPGGRILVAGSGTGGGCLALAAAGFDVRGIDFSGAMVRLAIEEAERRRAQVSFVEDDLRNHDEPAGSLAAVLFTYDTYSFLAARADRIALLRRAARWLEGGGSVFLSARRALRFYERCCLAIQYAATTPRGERRFGDSHTRWIAPSGELRRSFLHVFTARQLARETAAAGFRIGPWEGGHAILRRP